MVPVTPFFTGPRFRIGHLGALMLVCFEGATDLEDLDHLERSYTDLYQHHPKIHIVTVIDAGYMTVNGGVIERGAQLAARHRDRVGTRFVIINGRGLMAVMARAALAAFSMLDRSENKLRIFARLSEAVPALQETLSAQGTLLSADDAQAMVAFIEPQTATRAESR